MDQDEAIEALRRIPGYADRAEGACAERLGGLTNLVWRVDLPDGPVVLRLPGAGTEAYIDREVEAHNSRVAAGVGVSPDVLWCDAASGVMLTRHVEGVTMTPELFRARAGAPTRAALAFRRLHGSGETFRFRFEVFAMIDEYLGVLAGLETDLPEGYHAAVAEAATVRAAIEAHPVDLAPSHCDPLCENFLDTGERMWIVDWEYSGMNDPLWDLGDLSVEAGFGPAEDREMLGAWCDGPPTAAQAGRMVLHKAMCDLLWTLWGLIQHGNANPADDFWAYATGRFDRCRRLMASPEFTDALRAVRAG